MKKTFIIAISALSIFSSCDKSREDNASPRMIPLTISATIGDPDTKVSYALNENVLETAWENGDQLSVISVNGSGQILHNDIFSTTGSGKTATFTGSITDDANTYQLYVYYPALTATYDGKPCSPADNAYVDYGVLHEFTDVYSHYRNSYFLQTALDSPSHLKHYTVLFGQADLAETKKGTLDVTLAHETAVIKVDFTLPVSNETVYYMDLTGSSLFTGSGWGWINTMGPVNGDSNINICFGSNVTSGKGTGLTVSGTTATAYLPLHVAGRTLTAGATLETFVRGENGNYSVTKTLSADWTPVAGKMYRMSVTLAAI